MDKFNVTFSGYDVTLKVNKGSLLLDAAKEANIVMQADCGGKGTCGKCEAIITKNNSSDAPEKVLMCRKLVDYDMTVEILSSSVSTKIENFSISYKQSEKGREINIVPFFEIRDLKLNTPSLSDTRSDIRRVNDAIPSASIQTLSIDGIRNAPKIIREGSFKATVITAGENIYGISSANCYYGVAFDIGTSSICSRLINLRNGDILCSSVCANPQKVYGADVSSRCSYIDRDSNKLSTLRKLIVEKCERMIEWLCEKVDVRVDDLACVGVSGNTIMLHIFMGVDPSSIGEAPYAPVFTESITTYGVNIGFKNLTSVIVKTLPCVSGYIGADALAGVVKIGMICDDAPVLLVDLGTNAEIILKANGNIYACAAAAGPSIEGAHMSCGMNASPGAVSSVSISEALNCTVIGDGLPTGICGTGTLDAISELFRIGVIQENGRYVPGEESIPENLVDRMIMEGMSRSFVIVPPLETKNHRSIAISQSDVRAFQMGKSAVRTGIEILLETAGISASELRAVYLAGALGDNIDPVSAVRTGVIPKIDFKYIKSVGNAALDGTVDCLLKKEKMREAVELATRIRYIELSSVKGFMDRYVGNMSFDSNLRA